MDKIFLPRELFDRIIYHIIVHLPEETCGLLAGINNEVTMIQFVTNQLHSPDRYYMEPIELYKSLIMIEDQNLELIGIFHSHPKGPPKPSETDIKEFLYPGVATLICSPKGNDWDIKSFLIENNKFTEIDLIIV